MALSSSNVEAGSTGAVYIGPTSAAAPTTSTSATTGYSDLGYLSDDGITEARSRDTNDITAWQGGAVVRTAVTSAGLTFQFTMIETNAATVGLYYGVTVDADGSFDIDPSQTGGRHSFIIDELYDADVRRTYIDEGEVTEIDDRTNVNGEVIGYSVTITAYPSSALGNKCARVWMDALAS